MTRFDNGHHRVKVAGKTHFPGPLEALPSPGSQASHPLPERRNAAWERAKGRRPLRVRA
jgi:hypothetical protein